MPLDASRGVTASDIVWYLRHSTTDEDLIFIHGLQIIECSLSYNIVPNRPRNQYTKPNCKLHTVTTRIINFENDRALIYTIKQKISVTDVSTNQKSIARKELFFKYGFETV